MVHSRNLSLVLFLLLSLAVNFVGWTQTAGTAARPNPSPVGGTQPAPRLPPEPNSRSAGANSAASSASGPNAPASSGTSGSLAAPLPAQLGETGTPRPGATMQESLEKQLRSTDKQWESIRAPGSFWVQPKPWTIEPPLVQTTIAVNCDPMPEGQLKAVVAREAKRNQLNPVLLAAVIEQESNRYPCAQSGAGAMGMMQLMPATAAELEVNDPWDPVQNIMGGSRYLKQLMDRYSGDTVRALAAYNAGPGRVDREGGVPEILETKNYVQRIMERAGLANGNSNADGVVRAREAKFTTEVPDAEPQANASTPGGRKAGVRGDGERVGGDGRGGPGSSAAPAARLTDRNQGRPATGGDSATGRNWR